MSDSVVNDLLLPESDIMALDINQHSFASTVVTLMPGLSGVLILEQKKAAKNQH